LHRVGGLIGINRGQKEVEKASSQRYRGDYGHQSDTKSQSTDIFGASRCSAGGGLSRDRNLGEIKPIHQIKEKINLMVAASHSGCEGPAS